MLPPAAQNYKPAESVSFSNSRFATKPTGACSTVRLKGEQTGKEPMGRNEDESGFFAFFAKWWCRGFWAGAGMRVCSRLGTSSSS